MSDIIDQAYEDGRSYREVHPESKILYGEALENRVMQEFARSGFGSDKGSQYRDWWIRGYQSVGIDALFPPHAVHHVHPRETINEVLRIVEAVQKPLESEDL